MGITRCPIPWQSGDLGDGPRADILFLLRAEAADHPPATLDLKPVLRLAAANAQAIPKSPEDLALLLRRDRRRMPIAVIDSDQARNPSTLSTHQAVHVHLECLSPTYEDGLVLQYW